jgi:N-acetylglucosaminyldiphosphoundecaprenol N-acetyl-beta-D-mannosaminyltransferase
MAEAAATPPLPDPVEVLGVPVHPLTVEELHGHIAAIIAGDDRELVLHVNVHGLNLAHRHTWLRDLFRSARIVFCDGAGVMLGARILGNRIPARITYADWMWQLAAFASERGYRLFFLGAREGVADRAAENLRRRYPDLAIVGCHHGYFDTTPQSAENRALLAWIERASAHILVVGFGMPLQERWLLENRSRIAANVSLSGGAVFDYLAGELRRPPAWMHRAGLEWLGRLFIEPRRLAGRYLIGNPVFLARILWQRVAWRSRVNR